MKTLRYRLIKPTDVFFTARPVSECITRRSFTDVSKIMYSLPSTNKYFSDTPWCRPLALHHMSVFHHILALKIEYPDKQGSHSHAYT